MVKFILRVDSFIQRCVDQAAFAVMRLFGVRKSFVRYAAYLTIVGLLVLRAALKQSALLLVVGMVWLAVSEFVRRHDVAAENAGKLSRLDEHSGFMKGYWLVGVTLDVVTCSWLSLATNAAFLAVEYLKRTPNSPPPSEQREPSLSAVPEAT